MGGSPPLPPGGPPPPSAPPGTANSGASWLLIDRERRRHRDAALVRQRVGVRPESHVEAEAAETHPPTKPELDPFPLVAGHAAPHREQAEPLLAPHVHDAAAPGVQDVGAERRVAAGGRAI